MAEPVTVIAEAGINHNGSIKQAKELINVAVEAGADYIKFQTFIADKLVSKKAKPAKYQSKNLGISNNDSQYEMLKKLELSEDQYRELNEYCYRNNIKFLSTPFDKGSADMLINFGIDYLKVPSGELTNKPFLKCMGSYNMPVILSTGMGTLSEIQDALYVLTSQAITLDDITVLHCNTEYPTPFKDVNLRAMSTIKRTFDVKIGYSDHTLGVEVPVAAVALGAKIIEKHFTLDRNLPGPDHKASLEPGELKEMVKYIRNIEMAMGTGVKKASPSELSNIPVARKSIHTAKDLSEGDRIKASDLIMLRPGDGISPMRIDEIIGKIATRDIINGEKVDWGDIT